MLISSSTTSCIHIITIPCSIPKHLLNWVCSAFHLARYKDQHTKGDTYYSYQPSYLLLSLPTCTYLQLHQPFGQIGCVQWKADGQVSHYGRVLWNEIQQEAGQLRSLPRL